MNSGQGTMGRVLGGGHYALSEEVKVLAGYKRTEVGVVPEDWSEAQLRDIGVFMKGRGISRDDVSWNGVPCIRYGELYTLYETCVRTPVSRVTEPAAAQSLQLETGDLLFTGSGETAEEIGKCVAYLGAERACAGGDIIVLRPFGHGLNSALYLGYLLNHDIVVRQKTRLGQGNSVVHINARHLGLVGIPLPPPAEQRAIVEALSDVDGLLAALEVLVAKKRDIKQAAMQQLLTGKTCLPGFSGEWTEKPLIDLAAVTMGQSPPSISYNLRGEGLPLVQGKADIADRRTLDRVWTTQVSKRCDSGDLLLTVRAPVGTVAVARKAACLGRGVCGLKPIDSSAFLFHALVYAEDRWRILEQGSTFTAANSKQVGQFRLRVPTDENEQRAIAAVLSDMDAEIAVLERRRDKTLAIKQGMMQQLLSGRVRLVKLEEVTAQTAVTVSVARKHNWQFNEAVVISALIRKFGSKQYPLGRMRYTKLSYLLHRREEGYAEGYLKKAAGPYNPRTRYGGPEKIALQNDYVRQYKSGKRQGFVAGTNVDEAERYFDKWYGSEVLQWLEKFRYKTNDDLELLTTVDMAAEELRGTGEEVSVESVREVIHRHPEWNPKLDRPIFTDVNLARAIEICRTLFAVGGDEVAP